MDEDAEKRKDCDIIVKLLLIGNASVGKTVITQKFLDNNFSKSTMSTIGIDLQNKIIEVNGKKVKFLIWDTAGDERMKSVAYSYYRACQVILIVYDITSPKSFDNVQNWVDCVSKFAKQNVVKILVGNKIDLEDERKISTEMGKQLGQKYNIKFYEISALKLTNLKEMFNEIAEDYIKLEEQKGEKTFNLNITVPKKKKGCC